MEVIKVKNRSLVFVSKPASSWDLNLHLIYGVKHNFLIDTGLGSNDMDEVKKYLVKETKPLIVINTHYHWDHIWGNYFIDAHCIIAHELCKELIESEWEKMMGRNINYKRGNVELKLPNLLFNDRISFPEDGIEIFYSPGHTKDSISVLDTVDKILNAGDNIGDTLEDIVPQIYCDKTYLPKTINYYLTLDFDTIVSGHNRVLDKEILQKIKEKL